jgi:hypothetical protein
MIYDVRSELFKRFLVFYANLRKEKIREMLNNITLKPDFNPQKPMGAATSV